MTARRPRMLWLALLAAALVLPLAVWSFGSGPVAPPVVAADLPPACSSCDARHQRLSRLATPQENDAAP